jgi:hypothetical protein
MDPAALCVGRTGAGGDRPPRTINDVTCSADGSLLVAGCSDGYLVVWGVDASSPSWTGVKSPSSFLKPRSSVPIDTVRLFQRVSDAGEPSYFVVMGVSNNASVQVFHVSAGFRAPELVCTLAVNLDAGVSPRAVAVVSTPHLHVTPCAWLWRAGGERHGGVAQWAHDHDRQHRDDELGGRTVVAVVPHDAFG